MIFPISFAIYVVLGYLFFFSQVSAAAYEININGQRFQVNVMSETGERYHDRIHFTDDFGETLDTQPHAICSSLRGEQCQQVTNNGAKTPNLFNYFPPHTSQSVVAQANNKYNTDQSPYLLRQPMNERILQYLSRQNPHYLGTKPLQKKIKPPKIKHKPTIKHHNMAPLKLVKTQKISHKRKKSKKNNNNDAENDEEDEQEVEIELYSTGDDEALASALGLDGEELGETVDRIVAQLVAQYMDNDSEEVEVGQIFANEMSVENGEVSMEQIGLDEGSMQEISEMLNTIANKHKENKGEDGSDDVSQEAQIFALKFKVDNGGGDDEEGNDSDEVENRADE